MIHLLGIDFLRLPPYSILPQGWLYMIEWPTHIEAAKRHVRHLLYQDVHVAYDSCDIIRVNFSNISTLHGLVSAHEDRNMGVMDDVVADGAHDCSSESPLAPGSRHNYSCVLLLSYVYDHLAWFPAARTEFTDQLYVRGKKGS